MKKILILGGTQFIGRNLVGRLQVKDEYDITLFNRQQTQPDLFHYLKKIKGDRETQDIKQIANEHWDFVIDLSCFYPDALTSVLSQLKGKLKKYILISTCSVYDNERNHLQLRDEMAKTLNCTRTQRTDRTPATYGNRKAECERILMASGLDYVILRPSLVYGAYDHTDRFYYWLYQVKHNDTLMLPDNGERLFSVTYVNDLVATIVNALKANKSGVYNTITFPKASIRQIVDYTQKLMSKFNKEVNATPDFLNQNSISQWTDMPLWIDSDHFTYDYQKLQDDFEFEPTNFKDSIGDTIAYYGSLGWQEPSYGMTEKLRQALVEKIKTKRKTIANRVDRSATR